MSSSVFSSTPAIERANRLLSLRSNPGFIDLQRIAQDLVQNAADQCADYGGWDDRQIVVLKVRMQCAKEFKDLLFAKIIEAIREGVQEQAAASNLADKTPAEILDQGDYVRQQVLTKFEEFDAEGRLPGTY